MTTTDLLTRSTVLTAEPSPHLIHDPRAIFDFIVAYKVANDGNSPTLREIMAACGIPSSSVAAHILNRLEKQGLIVQAKTFKSSRSLRVVGGQWTYTPKEQQEKAS